MPVAARKETLDHLRSKKKPVLKTVYIPADDEIATEYNRLENEASMLQMQVRISPEDPELRGRHAAAQKAFDDYTPIMRENSIKFVFRSIGRKRLDALILLHPPTDEDRKEALGLQGEDEDLAGSELSWSPKTFPMALLAKSMIEPELTEPEILEWMDDDEWGSSEIMTLFTTAMEANTTHQLIALGKESGKTPASN